jgi:hypothetical protein
MPDIGELACFEMKMIGKPYALLANIYLNLFDRKFRLHCRSATW